MQVDQIPCVVIENRGLIFIYVAWLSCQERGQRTPTPTVAATTAHPHWLAGREHLWSLRSALTSASTIEFGVSSGESG